MPFKEDLAFGQKYEKESLKILEHKEARFPPAGLFKEWDFELLEALPANEAPLTHRVSHQWIKYEVKAQRGIEKWGNFVIEYKWNGKPSGIETTLSDYYIIHSVGQNKVWKIPTSKIKQNIRDKKFKKVVAFQNGKGLCYLLNAKNYDSDLIN